MTVGHLRNHRSIAETEISTFSFLLYISQVRWAIQLVLANEMQTKVSCREKPMHDSLSFSLPLAPGSFVIQRMHYNMGEPLSFWVSE